jgi:PadR family transcriptional regulator PadR
MADLFENWRTQIRKGYLELCVLTLIETRGKVYGFELLETLSNEGLEVKEGTLYPILNRMGLDGTLESTWDTENLKGHPRKFYRLTKTGQKTLANMRREFIEMLKILKSFENERS